MIDLFLTHFSDEQLKKRDNCILYKMSYSDLDVRVIASQIPPRHSRWQYNLELGRDKLDYIFNGTPLRSSRYNNVGLFCFPERWLSPKEICNFMEKTIDGFKQTINKFWIVTGSSVIITDCTADMVKVLLDEEEEKELDFLKNPI